jgi:hypothetical protein
MDRPTKASGVRLCIAVRKQGVTLYGNAAAMRSLAEHLLWIANSDPAEHFESQSWQLQSDACLFESKRPLDVWTLVESSLAKHVTNGQVHGEAFDINFMAVEEGDLDELAEHQGSGILPKEP